MMYLCNNFQNVACVQCLGDSKCPLYACGQEGPIQAKWIIVSFPHVDIIKSNSKREIVDGKRLIVRRMLVMIIKENN